MNHTEEEIDYHAVLRYSIYIVEGLALGLTNLFIVATVARYHALRNLKEYIIIGGLALVDGLSGVAALAAGPYRIYLILTYQTNVKVSRWFCFWTIHNVLWSYAFPLQGICLSILSIDRLFAVSIPLRHLKFGQNYGLALIGGAFLFGLVQWLVAIWLVYGYQEPEVSPICLTGWGMDPDNYSFIYYEQLVGTFMSIVLYVFVFLVYKARMGKSPAANDRALEAKLKKQRKLTMSLGLSCICTFLFFGIPNVVILISHIFDFEFDIIVAWAYIINNINPIMNTVIYMKIKEMRMGMKAMIRCKQMPFDISQWNAVFPKEASRSMSTVAVGNKLSAANKRGSIVSIPNNNKVPTAWMDQKLDDGAGHS